MLKGGPESHLQGTDEENLEASQFIDNYRRYADSNLLLRRGIWSINMMAQPDPKASGWTVVSICAISSPSLKDFMATLAANLAGASAGRSSGEPIDAIQQSGRESFHTTIGGQNGTPSEVYQENMKQLERQGWRATMAPVGRPKQNEYFVWLARDKQYAALSVKPAVQAGCSTVTLIEVTPK
jgi:hypothetical protein